jgi:calcium/calmodulin-dependent protein kinase I
MIAAAPNPTAAPAAAAAAATRPRASLRYSALAPAELDGWLRVAVARQPRGGGGGSGGGGGGITSSHTGTAAPTTSLGSTGALASGLRPGRARRRYVRLAGAVLAVARSRAAAQPLWELCVRHAGVALGEADGEVVVVVPAGRTISLFADSPHDMRHWAYALRKAALMSPRIEDYYRIGPMIGEGMNGQVREARDLVTDEVVAVKMVQRYGRENEDDLLAREVQIVLSLEHPNVVRTFDVFVRKRRVYFVMEYVPGGELFNYVAQHTHFTERHAAAVIRDLFAALVYLHDRGIVHRDVKLENLLCASSSWPFAIKLADFGFSNFVPSSTSASPSGGFTPSDANRDSALTSFVGTPYYIAPEMLSAAGHGRPVDVWAAGVTLYILLSGKFPFGGATEKDYYVRVLNKSAYFPDEDWRMISAEAKNLIRGLLTKDPAQRLTARQALEHDWFSLEANVVGEDLPRQSPLLAAVASGPDSGHPCAPPDVTRSSTARPIVAVMRTHGIRRVGRISLQTNSGSAAAAAAVAEKRSSTDGLNAGGSGQIPYLTLSSRPFRYHSRHADQQREQQAAKQQSEKQVISDTAPIQPKVLHLTNHSGIHVLANDSQKEQDQSASFPTLPKVVGSFSGATRAAGARKASSSGRIATQLSSSSVPEAMHTSNQTKVDITDTPKIPGTSTSAVLTAEHNMDTTTEVEPQSDSLHSKPSMDRPERLSMAEATNSFRMVGTTKVVKFPTRDQWQASQVSSKTATSVSSLSDVDRAPNPPSATWYPSSLSGDLADMPLYADPCAIQSASAGKLQRRPSFIRQLLSSGRMSLDGFISPGGRTEPRDHAGRERSSDNREQNEDEKSAVPRKRNPASRQRFHFRSFYRPASVDQDCPGRFPNGGFKSDHERLPPKLARAQQRQSDRRRPEKRGLRIIGWMKRVAKLQIASQDTCDHVCATGSGKIDPSSRSPHFSKPTQCCNEAYSINPAFPCGGTQARRNVGSSPDPRSNRLDQTSPASSSPLSGDTGEDAVGESATGSSDVSSPDVWGAEMAGVTDCSGGSRDRLRMFAPSTVLMKTSHVRVGQCADPLERALD